MQVYIEQAFSLTLSIKEHQKNFNVKKITQPYMYNNSLNRLQSQIKSYAGVQ